MTATHIFILVGLAVITTSAEALEFRGNAHRALGAASLAITGNPPNESLLVSNLGSSGADGVAIEPADAHAPFEIEYASFASSTFSIRHRATDVAGSDVFVVTSQRHTASQPTEYETGGQAGDDYDVYFYSGPLKVFESTPAPPGVLVQSALIPQAVVLAPGASGAEFSIEYILPVPEELIYVPDQLSFTGDRIVIERIEPGGAAAGPPLSMDEIHVTVTDLEELTILSETAAPPSIPALSVWGAAALAGALAGASRRAPRPRPTACLGAATTGSGLRGDWPPNADRSGGA